MEWRLIPNTNEFYRINEFGQIQSCKSYGNTKAQRGDWHTIRPGKSKKAGRLKCILYIGYDATGNRIKKTGYIHQLVWQAFIGEVPSGFILDHIDNNPLNNYLSNLRLANVFQNMWNSRKRRTQKNDTPTSRYKGVSWDKSRSKWVASIIINKKFKFLGYFSIEEEAAKVYDKVASEVFNEFARINFV